MRSKPLFLALTLALLLTVTLRPPPGQELPPPPSPAAQGAPPPAAPPEAEAVPGPPSGANVIEGCTVTWYTEDTCGKTPDHPAYGITASGLPVVDGVTCAVDPDVIPLYSDVYVEHADGTVERRWATDTGVKGEWVDIYTPDYDYAIQCGLQTLTVYWTAHEE